MDETKWYLRKAHDNSEFGPVPFAQLREWAGEAQVAPMDRVSTDRVTWVKAPMVPQLEMDYLIEVGEDQYYGPTTVGALREFLIQGEVTLDTKITNCKDTTQLLVKELLEPQNNPGQKRISTSVKVNLQQRIRELESRLDVERRAREAAEHLVQKLEQKLAELAKRQ